jgi:hypothetical protein
MRTRSLAATSLSFALLFGASAAVGAQDDPSTLLAASLTATSTATSFHFLATADGTVNLGESFGGGAPLPISGTKAEGDVSINPQGVQLTFSVPLGPVSLSGALNYPNDGFAYVKLALPGASAADLWHKIAAGDMVSNVLASPAPGAPDMATQLQQGLTEAGAVLTNEGDVPCSAGTCTKLHLEVPATALDSTLGSVLPGESPAPSAAAAAPIPVDILVDNATQYIDSVTTHVVEATSGTDVTLTIQLSAFNTPVTITAPAPDQVTDAPLF